MHVVEVFYLFDRHMQTNTFTYIYDMIKINIFSIYYFMTS